MGLRLATGMKDALELKQVRVGVVWPLRDPELGSP